MNDKDQIIYIVFIVFISVSVLWALLSTESYSDTDSGGTKIFCTILTLIGTVYAIYAVSQNHQKSNLNKSGNSTLSYSEDNSRTNYQQIYEYNTEKWSDYTKNIYKTPIKIYGYYYEDANDWEKIKLEIEYKGIDLIYSLNPDEYTFPIDSNDFIRSYVRRISPIRLGYDSQRLLLFLYKDDWYITDKEITLEDAKVLIDDTELRRKQKLERQIQRAKNRVRGHSKESYRKPIPDDVKIFVWNRDSGKCVKCGSKENLEYDHIIPLSKGGSNTARNLQLLCEICNREKGDKIG